MAPALCQPSVACAKLGFPVKQVSFCSLHLISKKNYCGRTSSFSLALRRPFYVSAAFVFSFSLPVSFSQNIQKPFAVLCKVKKGIPKIASIARRHWGLCRERVHCNSSGYIFSAQNCGKLSRVLLVKAKGDDSTPSEMSFENALKLLGVEEKASFDEILRAKKGLVESSAGDEKRISQVEAAYDALLMQRLMKRRAGEVVDNSVLYADVKASKSFAAKAGSNGVKWLRSAISSVPLTVETPSLTALGSQTAVYGVLMAWVYANVLVSSTGNSFQDTRADVPGLILAIGFGASLFFLRKQHLTLGKAAVVTTASLVAGAVVGGMVESWLRVDIVPVFGVGSPAVVISEFVLLSLWLASLYLR